MNPTQEVIKAWWFDRLSDLVAQNMALAAEVQAMREQHGQVPAPPQYGANGQAAAKAQERN